MNEMDMVNEPVAVTFAGKPVKAKRLSSIRRRAIIEAVIIEKYVAGILQQARLAYADNEAKRGAYIDKAMLAMPQGKAMSDLVSDHIPGKAYARMFAEATGIDEDQIVALLDDATPDEVRILLRVISGKKKT